MTPRKRNNSEPSFLSWCPEELEIPHWKLEDQGTKGFIPVISVWIPKVATKSRRTNGRKEVHAERSKMSQHGLEKMDGQQSTNALALGKDVRERASSPFIVGHMICGYKFSITYQRK